MKGIKKLSNKIIERIIIVATQSDLFFLKIKRREKAHKDDPTKKCMIEKNEMPAGDVI